MNIDQLCKLMEEVEAKEMPIPVDRIEAAFDDLFYKLGIEGYFFFHDVEFGTDNDIIVSFTDEEENIYTLTFVNDIDEGPCLLFDDSEGEDEEEEVTLVQLKQYNVPTIQTDAGDYVNVSDLSWMDGEILLDIIKLAGFPIEIVGEPSIVSYDEFGNLAQKVECLTNDKDYLDGICEIFKVAIRGGRKVKLNLVRRRKKRLTPKQKAGLRKAKVKRKRSMRKALVKRKKSLKLRKKAKIKSKHLPKGLRVTA